MVEKHLLARRAYFNAALGVCFEPALLHAALAISGFSPLLPAPFASRVSEIDNALPWQLCCFGLYNIQLSYYSSRLCQTHHRLYKTHTGGGLRAWSGVLCPARPLWSTIFLTCTHVQHVFLARFHVLPFFAASAASEQHPTLEPLPLGVPPASRIGRDGRVRPAAVGVWGLAPMSRR